MCVGNVCVVDFFDIVNGMICCGEEVRVCLGDLGDMFNGIVIVGS